MTKTFDGLDSFLRITNMRRTAVGMKLTDVYSEFSLTRDEFVAALKDRNYSVAEATGIVVWHKKAEEIKRVTNGGDYDLLEQA